jgi:hypothetical protein
MDHILGGIDVVNATAIVGASLNIEGAVQVDTAVSPGMGLHIGNENVILKDRIMCVFLIHRNSPYGSMQ